MFDNDLHEESRVMIRCDSKENRADGFTKVMNGVNMELARPHLQLMFLEQFENFMVGEERFVITNSGAAARSVVSRVGSVAQNAVAGRHVDSSWILKRGRPWRTLYGPWCALGPRTRCVWLPL